MPIHLQLNNCDTRCCLDLKRCLSLRDLTFLAIGAMLGGGLYVVTGTVSRNSAGPSVVISYLIAALATGLSAICYAELGARVPVAGSSYQFAYFIIGELPAFMIGWNVLVSYIVGVATTAKVWSSNCDAVIGSIISSYLLEHVPLRGYIFAPYPDLVAAAILTITVGVLLTGVKPSSTVNVLFAIVNLAVIAVICGVGFYLGSLKNWTDTEGGFFPFGIGGTISGAASLIYSFIGYEVIASTVEEAKNPKQNVPLALLLSIVAVVITYLGASAALTLMVPYYKINAAAPFPSAFKQHGWQWTRYVVTAGVLVASYAPMIAMQYIAPRYLMSMARDGLMMPIFAKVNDRTNVPYMSTIACGSVSVVVATIFKQETLVELLAIGQLLTCTTVAICLIKLRYEPNSLRCDQTRDDILQDQPIAGSTATEKTPLHQTNYDARLFKLTTHDLTNSEVPLHRDNTIKVTAGELKHCVQLHFCEHASLRKISSQPPGTVPKWILSVAIIFGLVAIAIGRFTPVASSLPTAIVLTLSILVSFLSISSLLLFHQDNQSQSFTVPFVPFLPFSCVIVNVLLVVSLQPGTWIRLFIWLSVGLLLYLSYAYRHSAEGNAAPPKQAI